MPHPVDLRPTSNRIEILHDVRHSFGVLRCRCFFSRSSMDFGAELGGSRGVHYPLTYVT